jgi:hypothetical protein
MAHSKFQIISERWAPGATWTGGDSGARSRTACRLKTSNSIAGMASTPEKVCRSILQAIYHCAKVTCARRCHLRTCAGFDFYVRRL